MKSGTEIWKRIKEDWHQYHSVILIIGGVLIVMSLIGKGICPLANLWGFPCPGCGMTRSFVLLLMGDWHGSWEMHPFPAAWILLAAAAGAERYVFQKNGKWKMIVLVILAAGMIAWYLYRMVTVFPNAEPYIYIEGNMMERIVPGYAEFVRRFVDGV